MTLVESIQNRINTKIFNRLGSSVTRKPFNSKNLNDWGDETVTYASDEAVTAVPYSYLQAVVEFKAFADLSEGETFMAFQHDQALNEKDLIVYDSKTFIVKEIEKFPLQNDNLVKIARLAEQVA